MAEITPEVVAPVAPETPVVQAPAPEGTAPPESGTPEGEKPEAKPERTFSQKEVDEISAKSAAKAERRAMKIARAEAEANFWKEQAQKAQQPQNHQAQGKPDPKDFKDWESYQDAVVDWKLEQRLQKQSEEKQRETRDEQHVRTLHERAQFVRQKLVAPGTEKYPDFEEVALAEDVPISEAMAAAVARLKNGHDVLYHLGSNREEALRISGLSEVEQVWEIKNLESKLTAPPKPTSAPPPIKPSTGSAPVEKGYRPDMSDKEFSEWRRRSIAQRR